MTDNDKKPRLEVVETPAGTAVFPWITRKDTKFDPDGVFRTGLALPYEEKSTQDLIAKLEKIERNFFEKLDTSKQRTYTLAPVFEQELDEDGEPTGNALFKFKLNAKVETRDGSSFEQEPTVAFANVEDAGKPIYSGSILRIKAQVAPYTNAVSKVVGLSLRMRGVLVEKLVTSDNSDYWSNFS